MNDALREVFIQICVKSLKFWFNSTDGSKWWMCVILEFDWVIIGACYVHITLVRVGH